MTTISMFLPSLGVLLTALIGMAVWRYQLIHKRRYEVAEEAVLTVGGAVAALHSIRRAQTEARDVAARSPGSLPLEPWFATHAQLTANEVHFERLGEAVKSIAMHFGDQAAAPLLELQAIHKDLASAQWAIYHRSDADKLFPTEQQKDQLEEWRKKLSQQGDDDPLTRRIDHIHDRMRIRFGRHLRPSILRLFWPFWG